MAEDTGVAKLLIEIEALKAAAVRARRLSENIHNDAAQRNLRAYAEELESKLQELVAQATAMKEVANVVAAPDQAIAVLRPETYPKP